MINVSTCAGEKLNKFIFKYFKHDIDYVNFPAFSIRINSKRNFDEIGHGNDWGRFVRKRSNFDEIDGGRFDSRFVKKVNISIVVPYIFYYFLKLGIKIAHILRFSHFAGVGRDRWSWIWKIRKKL